MKRTVLSTLASLLVCALLAPSASAYLHVANAEDAVRAKTKTLVTNAFNTAFGAGTWSYAGWTRTSYARVDDHQVKIYGEHYANRPGNPYPVWQCRALGTAWGDDGSITVSPAQVDSIRPKQ